MKHIIGHYVRSPEVELTPGMQLRVKTGFLTVGHDKYDVGHILTLIERTDEAPHGYISSLGNWRVKNQQEQVSVWSSIDWLVADKHLEIIAG